MLSSGLSSFHALSRNPWDLTQEPRRQQRRRRRRLRRRLRPAAPGHRHRRLDPPAGRLVRRRRPQAERRPHPDPAALHRPRGRADDAHACTDAALVMAVLSQPDGRDATSLPYQDIAWSDLDRQPLRGLRIGLWLDAGWGLAVDARRARRDQRRRQRLRSAPARSSSRCAPFTTRAMADGIDLFWRMRAWLDISALPAERQAQVLPYIRELGRGRRGAQRRAGLPRLQPDGRAARRRRRGHASASTSCSSPVSPVVSFPAEWASPLNDPARPFEHIAFTLPFNMSEQPAARVTPATARPACRSACRSSAGATTTSACCAWRAPGSSCAGRSARGPR